VTDGVLDEFEVRRIVVENLADLDTYVVGLAEKEDGSGGPLLLQTAVAAADEQDHALGMDTYGVSTAWGASVYSGVCVCQAKRGPGCVLRDDLLILRFTAVAVEMLGVS